LVIAKMPDVAFFLQETRGVPAQVSVTQNAEDGVDVAIQGIPVEIRLPPGFIRPQRTKEQADVDDLPDVTTTAAPFDATDPDSLQITLRDFDPSSIFVRVNVRMTAGFDFSVDTQMPITTAPVDIPIRSWHLKIFRFVVQTTGEPQALGEIEAVLVAGSSPQNNWAFGIDYNDDGVLIATAIIPIENRVRLFRILNREVRLIGLKIGYSLFEPDPRRVGERPSIVIPLGDVG